MPHWRKHHWLSIKKTARHAAAALLLGAAGGCANLAQPPGTLSASQISTLDALNSGALLLGEQHDATQHQQLHASVIAHLIRQQRLAAVVIEMASSHGETTHLDSNASEPSVQDALGWTEQAWPWEQYGPAIMQAVRAHIPVIGGNLDTFELRASMQDTALQQAVSADVWAHHLEAVDRGHCGLIPASQLTPMALVQVARDQRMAQAIERASVPGKVVVLLAGSAHADKQVGVAQHLSGSVTSIAFVAGAPHAAHEASFDAVWQTPALPAKDYCAALKARFKR